MTESQPTQTRAPAEADPSATIEYPEHCSRTGDGQHRVSPVSATESRCKHCGAYFIR